MLVTALFVLGGSFTEFEGSHIAPIWGIVLFGALVAVLCHLRVQIIFLSSGNV